MPVEPYFYESVELELTNCPAPVAVGVNEVAFRIEAALTRAAS